MKKIILYLTLLMSVKSYSQAIEYLYDGNGNRTERHLYVCPSCPAGGRKAAPADTLKKQEQLVQQYGVNVYPNPTQDKINLSLNNLQNNVQTIVTVADEAGKILYTGQNLQPQNEINMASYNNGTYFIRLLIGKDVMVYKIMKVQ